MSLLLVHLSIITSIALVLVSSRFSTLMQLFTARAIYLFIFMFTNNLVTNSRQFVWLHNVLSFIRRRPKVRPTYY